MPSDQGWTEGGASLTVVVSGYYCKSHGIVISTLVMGGRSEGAHQLPGDQATVVVTQIHLAFGTLLVTDCHLCNVLLFLCAVFLCPRPFLGGPRQEFFPVSFHVLVVSPYKGTFSPYGAKLRTQQPRQFFWVRARIFSR